MAYDPTKLALVGVMNHVIAATITASEEAAGYDADNLKVPSYGAVSEHRTTTVDAARNLDFDLLAIKSDIEAITLWGVNWTDAAEWRIFADDTAGFPTPHEDSTLIDVFDLSRPPYVSDTPPWGRPAIFLPATTWAARYIRIQVTDTANPAGYLKQCYATIGPVIQPGKLGRDWRPGREWIGPPGRSVSVRNHAMTARLVDEATRRGLDSIADALMASGRFGVIPRPADPASWVSDAVLATLSPGRLPEALPIRVRSEIRYDYSLSVQGVNS